MIQIFQYSHWIPQELSKYSRMVHIGKISIAKKTYVSFFRRSLSPKTPMHTLNCSLCGRYYYFVASFSSPCMLVVGCGVPASILCTPTDLNGSRKPLRSFSSATWRKKIMWSTQLNVIICRFCSTPCKSFVF